MYHHPGSNDFQRYMHHTCWNACLPVSVLHQSTNTYYLPLQTLLLLQAELSALQHYCYKKVKDQGSTGIRKKAAGSIRGGRHREGDRKPQLSSSLLILHSYLVQGTKVTHVLKYWHSLTLTYLPSESYKRPELFDRVYYITPRCTKASHETQPACEEDPVPSKKYWQPWSWALPTATFILHLLPLFLLLCHVMKARLNLNLSVWMFSVVPSIAIVLLFKLCVVILSFLTTTYASTCDTHWKKFILYNKQWKKTSVRGCFDNHHLSWNGKLKILSRALPEKTTMWAGWQLEFL